MKKKQLHYRTQDLLIVALVLVFLVVGSIVGWWIPFLILLAAIVLVSLIYTDPLSILARAWTSLEPTYCIPRSLSVVFDEALKTMKSVADLCDFWPPADLTASYASTHVPIQITTPERKKWSNPFKPLFEICDQLSLQVENGESLLHTNHDQAVESVARVMEYKVLSELDQEMLHDKLSSLVAIDAFAKDVLFVLDHLVSTERSVIALREDMVRHLVRSNDRVGPGWLNQSNGGAFQSYSIGPPPSPGPESSDFT